MNTYIVSCAQDARYSDFSEELKKVLYVALNDHPRVKSYATEIDSIRSMKRNFSAVSGTDVSPSDIGV